MNKNDKLMEYVNYLVNEIKKYQEKNLDILNSHDYEVLPIVIATYIYSQENKGIYGLPLAFIIGNYVNNYKPVKNEQIHQHQRDKEYDDDRRARIIINGSSFLTMISKKRNLLADELLDNIPAILCYAKDGNYKAEGFTEDNLETIYEIQKNDERPSTRDLKLVSYKEAVARQDNYFHK